MNKTNDYPVSRVPENMRLPFISVALVHMGMLTALDQFMLGAVLGHSMTLTEAFIAIFTGSLIFGFVTIGLGFAGMREGLSGSLLARWCGFGRFGSVLISSVIAVSLLGWFGVQNSVFANGLNYALNGRLGFGWSAAISGTVLTCLVAYGFKALRFTAGLAVPLFIIVIGYISVTILTGKDITPLTDAIPAGTPLSINAGITMVVGGCIVASLITPDMTRYCRNGRHVFWMTVASIITGEFIINGLAILIARTLNTSEVVTIMAQTAGGIGLLAVIFSTLRINDVNLYSSSLSVASAIEGSTGRKIPYTLITLLMGFIGTTLSVMGILEQFVDFLTLLGVLFPPVLGVMLMDYYILRTHRALLDESRLAGELPNSQATSFIGWPAIISWIAGTFTGWIVEWGIPSLNALLAAALLYWLIICVMRKVKNPAKAERQRYRTTI